MGDTAGHYFEPDPAATSRPRTIRLDLPDRSLELRTDRGVFSVGRVDPATKYLLLEAPEAPERGTFVDLGCGYGAIAWTRRCGRWT
jgi:16S rRNA (guanine1207-N2)-methyltransferase